MIFLQKFKLKLTSCRSVRLRAEIITRERDYSRITLIVPLVHILVLAIKYILTFILCELCELPEFIEKKIESVRDCSRIT